MKTRWLLLPALAVLCEPAHAHVAPAEQENNRYLKLNPLGDQIRLAYTIYYGEVPGQAVRKTMDENGDGVVSEEEADTYANRIASEVASTLEVTVDGVRIPLVWEQSYAALDDRTLAGGSFPLDMVAWLCLSAPREKTEHTVTVWDKTALPVPGETGLRIDASPGISIAFSRRKGDTENSEDMLARAGEPMWPYDLRFTVDPENAIFAPKKQCIDAPANNADSAGKTSETPPGELPVPIWALVTLGALALVGVGVFLRRRE